MRCDTSLLKKFNDKINETTIFYQTTENENINLISTTISRLNTSIAFLNKENVLDENNLILTIVYIDIVKQCVYKLLEIFNIDNLYINDNNFFNETGIDGQKVSDDEFFSYIRALSFAHSIGTDKHFKFKKENETHYSPWIQLSAFGNNQEICLRVFSSINQNSWESIKDIRISLNSLYDYLISRYNLLILIIKNIEEKILKYKEEWQKNVITYNENEIEETINQLIEICEERCENFSLDRNDLLNIKKYITCKITNDKNIPIVNEYKHEIIKSLREVCAATNNLNEEDFDQLKIYKLLSPGKADIRRKYHYNIEKIFCYLDHSHGQENISWALQLLKIFYEEFLKKYIIIDENLTYDEIHLLINAALYFDENCI